MLTREGARLQVLLDIQRRYGRRRGPEEALIRDEWTIERSWGWVFFWTTRGWRDGDDRYLLAGNPPYMVNKHDGNFWYATARSAEESIQAYETALERQAGAWELVLREPADCSLAVASHIRRVLGLSIAEMGVLKRRLPCTLQTGALSDVEPVCQRLVAAGVRAQVRRAGREDP